MKKVSLPLLLLLLLFVTTLQAQEGAILYVDYEPDMVQEFDNDVYKDTLAFDMDQDGVCEWVFTQKYQHLGIKMWIQPNVYNDYWDTLHYYHRFRLHKCQLGDTLPNLRWEVEGHVSSADAQYWGYNVPGDYPHEIFGVRYLTDEGFCYGWFDFSAESYNPWAAGYAQNIRVTFHRSAFCTRPDYPLLAGQTDFCNIEDNDMMTPVIIRPNPTCGIFTITGSNLIQAKIYNTLGQYITAYTGNSSTITIDINKLPSGIYFVNITDDKGRRCVKKIVKQ